jgi:hypothetical protein
MKRGIVLCSQSMSLRKLTFSRYTDEWKKASVRECGLLRKVTVGTE